MIDDESPYPKTALERWADKWVPVLIWISVVVVLVALFWRAAP